MKFILKESQLINILKKEYNLNEEESQFEKFIKFWAAAKKDSETGEKDALGKYFYDSLVNDPNFDIETLNPNFDHESADLSDFEKIDIWPVNGATMESRYGWRNIGGNATKNHKGVDLGIRVGSPIYSPANGVVISAKNAGGKCGGFVKIDHGKYETKYCHLSKFDIVSKGDKVIKGQIIGLTGGEKGTIYAGNSRGPHLHYEVLVNGKHVNPETVHGRFS